MAADLSGPRRRRHGRGRTARPGVVRGAGAGGATVVGIDLRRRLRRRCDRPPGAGGRARRDHARPRRSNDPRQQRRDRPAAGRRRSRTRLEDIPLETFTRTVDVNLAGTFNAIQVFGRRWSRPASGSIVNIGSLYAIDRARAGFYDHLPAVPQAPGLRRVQGGRAAPHALLRAAVGPARRARERDLAGRRRGRAGRAVPGQVHRARPARPDGARPTDLGGPLVFLASDASRYVTGHELRVDGGFTA